ncbi:CU044_5270 family protein [Labedaea rhizosphaerae]|uniref:CU044_5270 family protein n=1 Tax=Labedaea rhizosphaerae TaxID=598644 RepID=A0A4R6S639_LABRH|nr:CU044_5270 family protein [Labedaea rhizosphaerae]TDP95141.1 hypothetical protein EV186_105373 [Labedaea rhizosphaerae]
MNELDMIGEVNADEPRAGTPRLATARERLMATIAHEPPALEHKRKHRKVRVASWTTVGVAAAAAAVVALVGAPTPSGPTPSGPTPSGPTPSGPAPVNAAFVLNQAADQAIHQKDEPIHPGQYRYVSEHISAVGMGLNGPKTVFAWREHDVETTWVPYDQSGTWTKDMRQVGPFEVLVDDGATPQDKAAMTSHYPHGRLIGRCGDFFSPDKDSNPCGRPFDDKQLTSAMIATIPRDPHKLLTDKYLGTNAGPALSRTITWLRSGLVPGDLRAAIYRALAMVPGIEITDNVANLDGHRGVAFGADTAGYRTDIVIDPATGQYIGFREVDDGTLGMPKGTVHDSSSMVTGVVDKVGQVPGH